MKVAIVGTGVSGLVAAYLLRRDHELTIFEADARIGGHTHTVLVDRPGGPLPVDTGFIVYNEPCYPNFTRLLAQLGVATQPSDMSFSVQCAATGLEYNGTSLDGLFAQRRNLLRPGFFLLLRDIARFYRDARALLAGDDDALTVDQMVAQQGYSQAFVRQHLVPMGAAIWSADPRSFGSFPARYLAGFLNNHGMLNLYERPRWRTISGGSRQYVDKITADFCDRIRLKTPVESVRRFEDRVEVTPRGGATERFDELILAVHSDQALALLADPSPTERDILGVMAYQPNETVLHTDDRLLPRSRRARASWNYFVPREGATAATVTYHMNRLQSLATQEDYCVTLNRTAEIDRGKIIRTQTYHHPVYSTRSIAAQKRWAEISGVRRTHYCGAYWGYGFHEDGVRTALAVGRAFGKSL